MHDQAICKDIVIAFQLVIYVNNAIVIIPRRDTASGIPEADVFHEKTVRSEFNQR